MARNPTWTATACLEEQYWASHIRVVCIVTGFWIFLWTGRLETFDPIHSALATLCGLFTAKIRWSESQAAIAKGVCPLCDRYFWFGSHVQRNFQLLLSGLCKLYKLSRSRIYFSHQQRVLLPMGMYLLHNKKHFHSHFETFLCNRPAGQRQEQLEEH